MKHHQGYSLLELSIVILILGIMAAVMIPEISPTQNTALDLAAGQYSSAIRFARAESIRTGTPHAIRVRDDEHFVTVESIDQSASPWNLVPDVYHPVKKQLYIVDLKQQANTRNVTTTLTTSYRGTCNEARNIYFDNHGAAWCVDLATTALIQADISISVNGQQRVLSLDGITGRVTVQ